MNPWMLEDIEDGYIRCKRGASTDEGYIVATEGMEGGGHMNPWMLEDIEDGYIRCKRGASTDEGYIVATEGMEGQDGL